MAKIPLLDVVRPYFFVGMDLGPGVHDALAALHVDEYESAWDDDGVLIWGVARIDSENPSSPVFSPRAGGGALAAGNSHSIEWHDIAIHFRLTIARRAAGALPVASVTDPATNQVLSSLGPTSGTSPSDFPNTQFRLELMFELVSLTLPDLIGARLDGWVLVPDPANREVKLTLPRVLLIITQDSGADTAFDVKLGSFGAETLDDADPAISRLLSMNPPYALAPGEQFGFGFKKAVLDLSDKHTPPDLLDRFGVGEDWQGVYLPEVRIFVSTQRSAGVAFNIGARELMIGIAPTAGLWGDFNFDVELLGDRLDVELRMYAVNGARLDPEWIMSDETAHADRYRITVPASAGPETENYVLYVDVKSGAAPFVITAVGGEEHPTNLDTFPDDAFFNDAGNHPEDISVVQRTRLFSHDQRVAIRVTSRNPAQKRVIVLDVYPDYQVQAGTRPAQPSVPRAVLTTTTAADASSVSIGNQTNEDVSLVLVPPDGVLMVDGNNVAVTDGRARVPVAANSSHTVIASWTRTGQEELERYSIGFAFDHPRDGVVGDTTTAGDLDALVAAWQAAPPGSLTLRVDAYASREAGTEQRVYNMALSNRRAEHLVGILVGRGIPRDQIQINGDWGNHSHPGTGSRLLEGQVPGDESANAAWENGTNPNYHPEAFRVAVASLLRPIVNNTTFEGELTREPTPPPEQEEHEPPAPPQGQHPGWLRHVGGTVRFERDAVPVAGELRLTADFKTAHEEGLEHFRQDVDLIGPGLEDPDEQARLPQGDPNPDDGVVEFRLAITYDPSTRSFTETLVARAAETDRDGLWSWGTIPTANATGEPASDGWRDVLGLYFTLAPLLATTAATAASGGEIVPLVIGLAAPVVITTLGVAHVLRFTHYGVELDVRHDEDEVHAALLFDVESAIWLDLKIGNFKIVTNRPDKPVKIRYKAIGFSLDVQPAQPTRFLPVFDSSRGYTIDLADSGSLRVLPSLGDSVGDIVQVLGARIARTNPLNIEVELGLGVDLGVFSVDRFGFRLPIDPLGSPSITAIGVGVDIPNALKGKGYLQIQTDGFAGQLDLTLPSVGMRVAGALAVRTVTQGDRSATGVLVTLAAELPSGIPLGGTGLAIFGFLGLFAMHHARLENTSARIPSLDWLVNVVSGDPTDIRGWGPALDQWAFGVGLVAGTIEGGTVLNLKGMLVLEVPGPRVLLFVKANILSKRPATKGTNTGALFAVVDVNPQRVLIGLQFEYHIQAVLDLMIPVEAGFFYDPPAFPPEHFYVDVGTIARPATAKILQLFDATAYFMVHGDGIPDFPLAPGGLQGFSIATGFRVSFTWGNTDIGLYLRVAAGFDAGIGFAPLFFGGRVFLDGELRLFIVSIEAHGELTFRSDGKDTRLEGRICGEVDFFFFSVEGCVGFALGTMPGAPFPPPPIRDLMLQSRSPALAEGTGVDRGIDTVLCHATSDGSVPRVEAREGDTVVQREVYVPIDAIPLVQFEVAPSLAAGATIDGQLSSGLPPGFGQGWQKRGPNFLKYEIRSVELKLVAIGGVPVAPGTAPVTEGPRPYTWRHPAQQVGSDGLPVELALLDWKPTNADKAMVQGPALDAVVDGRWGRVCTPVAEAASVLWTFRDSLVGPSPSGWRLTGEAWPDQPGAKRSLPVDTSLRAYEMWRTGTFLDGLLPGLPATVVGVGAPCPQATAARAVDPRIETLERSRLLAHVSPSPSLRDRRLLATATPSGAARALTSAAISTPLASALPVGAATIPQKCTSKVLQAPYELLTESLQLPQGIGDQIRKALEDLDSKRDKDLRDVVRLSGGPFVDLTLLLFARIKMATKGLIQVRAFAADGSALSVTTSFVLVSTGNEIPGTWKDSGGPWWDDVQLARAYFARLNAKGGWGEYVVHVKLPAAALTVDIGVSPLAEAIHNFGMDPPSFFLAVVEGLSQREVIRFEEDQGEADDDHDGLEDAVGDQKHALLRPNAQYQVIVHYSAQIGQKPEDPEAGQDPNEIITLRTVNSSDAGVGPDVRTFFTDAEPPRSLDPWMLAQFPAPNELYHFTDDPVVVVFATNDVLELFAAYSRQLRAVARAASFRGSAGTPEEPLTHLLLAGRFEPLKGIVFSPWEGTARRRLGALTCGDFNPDSDRHGRVILPFALDPLTDYVLDLEALTLGGAPAPAAPRPGEVGRRPLYRQQFTTSRYRSREAFATDVRTSPVTPQRVKTPAALAALADQVTDEIFDKALFDAGLEVRPRPGAPRITVLWGIKGPPAQPVAILIETPEPVWRTRLEPEPEYDASGIYIQRWVLARKTWLSVDELVRDSDVLVLDGGNFVRRATATKTTAAPTLIELRDQYLGPRPPPPVPITPPSTSLVSKFVRDESGTRTLALLQPGAAGKFVSLGLARKLHPLLDTDVTDTPIVLCEVDLAPPPWEEST